MASDPEHWTDVTRRSVTPGRQAGYGTSGPLGRVWRALEYSSAYLALVGAAEVLVVTYLLSLPLTPAPLVIALVTFAVYANDRLVDLESDGVSNPRRTAFIRRHRRELYVMAALSYGVGAALAALGGPVAFAIALLPGGAWLVYAIDWIAVPTVGFDRLKEVPLVSSLVVASVWSLAVVTLPVAFAGASVTPTVLLLFLYFLLAAFVAVEVANVRDIESDTESGAVTLATVVGVAGTRTVLYGVTLLAAAVVGVGASGGFIAVPSALVLALGIVTTLVVVALVGRTDAEKALTLAAECTRLPVFAVLTVLAFL